MTDAISPKPGARIGAFHSLTESTLLLLGYGVYEGDEIPPENIIAPEIGPPALLALAIPKLRLDDGTILWGCECWWNYEATVKALELDRQIVRPKLESIREKAAEAWKKANDALDAEEEALP